MFRDTKGTNLHIRNPTSLKLGKKEYSSALNSTTGEVTLQSECRIKALQAWECWKKSSPANPQDKKCQRRSFRQKEGYSQWKDRCTEKYRGLQIITVGVNIKHFLIWKKTHHVNNWLFKAKKNCNDVVWRLWYVKLKQQHTGREGDVDMLCCGVPVHTWSGVTSSGGRLW